jgi:hypothetical protein
MRAAAVLRFYSILTALGQFGAKEPLRHCSDS